MDHAVGEGSCDRDVVGVFQHPQQTQAGPSPRLALSQHISLAALRQINLAERKAIVDLGDRL